MNWKLGWKRGRQLHHELGFSIAGKVNAFLAGPHRPRAALQWGRRMEQARPWGESRSTPPQADGSISTVFQLPVVSPTKTGARIGARKKTMSRKH